MGGLYFHTGSSGGQGPVIKLTNCTLTGNTAQEGGGLYNKNSTHSLKLANCTLSRNRGTYGAAIYNERSPRLENCIVWGNTASLEGEMYGSALVSYSNIDGGWPGEGNIDTDPCFADAGVWDANGTPEDVNDDYWVNGDYHLKSQAGRWDPNSQGWLQDDVTSPCIDAGNPCTDVGEEPDPNGGVINMGAYGGTAEASKSLRAIPECFPSTYSTYNDWKALAGPCCWCRGYHCDGDADGATQGFQKYRVMSNDLGVVAANWKKLIDDATLDPCADIDHKSQGFQNYRVMSNDLAILIANWKKTDADLPGDCPRPE